MTNPLNNSRDDRRMDEGDKTGLSGKANEAKLEDVTPRITTIASPGESSTADREQPSELGGDAATRSRV